MGCKVVEGIMSVSGDSPTTCTPAKHRLRMVETAVRKNFWIRAGDFECTQRTPVRQINVLKHYQKKLSQKHDEPIRVLYVCGSEVLDDLVSIQSNKPPLWTHNEKNIYIIEDETFPNDLRCSRIRTALRRGESVKYCLDDDVIEYINEHNLYRTTPESDYEQCVSGMSTASAPNLSTSTLGRIGYGLLHYLAFVKYFCFSRRSKDDEKVPPPPPQRGSSEKLSEKYKNNMIPSAEWRTPPTSQPSSSDSCSSSREASEPRQLPPKTCHSAREPSTSERYSVKWSDALEALQKPPKQQPNGPDYASIKKSSGQDQKSSCQHQKSSVQDQNPNEVTVVVPAKEAVKATFSLQPMPSETTNALDGIPEELPKAAFMKPILSQQQLLTLIANEPEPAADSPVFSGNTTDCEAIPNCVISSVTSETCRGNLRTFADSPSYDNVTLDDLLAASTSWAEYLHKESERIE
ncbi:hypothetical protein COOONC_18927, partial [Cooperia oncophora]